MSRLSVELVPETAWWTNVRSNVPRKDWEKCKAFVRERSGNRCEICGGRGRRWPIECHEIWHYDDDNQVQTLVDLIALCPPCHEVKHIGHADVRGNFQYAFRHLMKVNEWQEDHAALYLAKVFEIWRMRSQMPWKLDITYLSMLGISTEVKDRP